MSIFLDLVGSLLIRGSMITVMLTLTVTLNDALYKTTQYANTREYLSVVADTVMYNDVVHAGHDYAGSPAFSLADAQQFCFNGNIDDRGAVETVQYYAVKDGLTDFFKLYRVEDYGTPLELGRKFTAVRFRYYDAAGRITTDCSKITAVQVTLAERIERVSFVENLQGLPEQSMTVTKDLKIYPSSLNLN